MIGLSLSVTVALLALPLLGWPQSGAWQEPTFSAFPYDGFVPEGGVGVHDPAVIDFDGHYLCFHTGPGIGALRTSEDLIHWKDQGAVMPELPDWLKQDISHRSIWAPEAIRYGRGLRLYYCASARFGHNDSWIGVAECPNFDPVDPKKGWRDLGPILESKDGRDNFNAIDPDVLADSSGRLWMYFGSYWSGLYVVELDPETGKLKDGMRQAKTLIAKNPSDRANGLEAPCCIFREGYYYLFVNYGLAAQGVNSTYQIVVGRSKSPNGPFLDSEGVDMVDGGHESFLNCSSPMFGPGGGVVFQDRNGRWLASYHYYDGRKFWHGHVWGLPTLQVRHVVWSEDGWPLPGLPVTPETVALQPHHDFNPVGHWTQQVDFGAIQTLEIKSDGSCLLGSPVNGRQPPGTWRWMGKTLELRWPKAEDLHEFWVDRLQLSEGGFYLVGRNQARMVIRAVRQGRGKS